MEIPKEHKSEFRPEHWTGKHCNWRLCQRLDGNYKKVVHMFMFAVDMLQCEGRCWRMSGNLSNLGARAAAPASNKDSPCNLMLLWLPSWGWHKERAYYTARPLISSQPWRGNCHPQRSRGQIEASTGAGQGENEEGFCCLRTDLWCRDIFCTIPSTHLGKFQVLRKIQIAVKSDMSCGSTPASDASDLSSQQVSPPVHNVTRRSVTLREIIGRAPCTTHSGANGSPMESRLPTSCSQVRWAIAATACGVQTDADRQRRWRQSHRTPGGGKLLQCSAMWFSAKVGSAARRGASAMQNSKIGGQHNMQRGAPAQPWLENDRICFCPLLEWWRWGWFQTGWISSREARIWTMTG